MMKRIVVVSLYLALAIILISCTKQGEKISASSSDSLLYRDYIKKMEICTSYSFNKINYDSAILYYELHERLLEKGVYLYDEKEENLFCRMIDTLLQVGNNKEKERIEILIALEQAIHYSASFKEYALQALWVKWSNPDMKFIEVVKNIPDSMRKCFIENTMVTDVDSIKLTKIYQIFSSNNNLTNNEKAKEIKDLLGHQNNDIISRSQK